MVNRREVTEKLHTSEASRTGGPLTIVVGVSGGIAAYKACAVVRLFKQEGHRVIVVPTPAALGMVGRTTWEALSGHPVSAEVDEGAAQVQHVTIGREADAVVVVPTTANTLAKLRAGMADNLLTSTVLTATCPVFVCPAMHTEMWRNPATIDNVETLRRRGFYVIEPAVGRLTGGDCGAGRLPEPKEIVERVCAELSSEHKHHSSKKDMLGMRVAISAGGTREPLDPVRFIGNRSSGRFGAAIAAEALRRGAQVTLVEANMDSEALKDAEGAQIVHAPTASLMHEAMITQAQKADVLIMSAAVADFRPVEQSKTKRKKTGEKRMFVELVETPDILADLASHRRRPSQVVVGFAAETGDSSHSVEEYGKAKAAQKGADIFVINRVGANVGFGDVDTSILIVDAAGDKLAQAQGSKGSLSTVILDAVASWRRV